MALRDDLLAFAPEIANDSRVDLMLTYAALRVNRRVWGSKADFGTVLLALHMLTRFSQDTGPAVGGPVSMEKVGDLQTQYGVLTMEGDEELATTAYGALFAQTRKGLGVSPLVV